MSDYISRKDLIDALNNNIRKSDMPFEWCQGMASAGYIIMHQPTADVTEVVRCKDCLVYDSHSHRCKYFNHGVQAESDYCSHAERRRG